MQDWISRELESVDIGDDRLNRRYTLLMDRFSEQPTLSILAACQGWSETEAAYRFFDNDKVTPAKLLAPHRQATLRRVRDAAVVLIAQDTTELNLQRKFEKVGGPLGDENHYGILVHPCFVMTTQRIPLGVIHADLWARDANDFHKRAQRANKRIEQKESYRWLQGYRQACDVANACPDTQVVCLSDSEGDIYDCFAEAIADDNQDQAEPHRQADWIVRAYHNRRLADPSGEKMISSVQSAAVMKQATIQVSQRDAKSGSHSPRLKSRAAREASVTIRATSVALKAPSRRTGEKLPEVHINVVLIREENAPIGENPVEWMLLTSLPIDSAQAVERVIEYYCCRWEIEIYFRVLKSGCQIEQLQLETTQRVSACVALYMVVAWRVMYVMMMGRNTPHLSCEVVFSPDEWQSVYTIVKHEPPPQKVPKLGEMLLLIASLGGHLNRKNDPPPGPKAMWIGLQKMRNFATAWNAFGPKQHGESYV